VVTALLLVGTWTGVVPGRVPPPYSVTYLLFWTVYAVGAWAWMAALVGLARQHSVSDTAAFRYGRRMGYAWYIVHQPVIIAVAYLAVQMPAQVGVKYLVILVVSLVGTVAITELLRFVPLVRRAIVPEPRIDRASLPSRPHAAPTRWR